MHYPITHMSGAHYGQQVDVGIGAPPPVPMTIPKGLFRYGEQAIWSSQFFGGTTNVAQSNNRLFANAFGQVGQGFTTQLSIAETSLKVGGQVPSGVGYDVFGIACQIIQFGAGTDGATAAIPAVSAADIQNIQNFVNNGVLSWNFTQTNVDIAPIALIGQGGGVFGAVSTTATTTTVGAMNNGAGGVFLYRKHPVSLPGQTTFGIDLRIGNRAEEITTNAVSVRVTLLGYYKNIIEVG